MRGQQPMDVVVWGEPSVREDVAAIRDLGIALDERPRVRLSDVADVRIAPMRMRLAPRPACTREEAAHGHPVKSL